MTYLEALDYAKSRKVVLPAEYYNELSAAQRSRATTIAGMASLDQIKAVIDLVHDALATGKTFKQFQDSVDRLFGKGKLGLPKGRLDNIFRTNIQVAYAQGRYQQQKRNADSRPYLLYSAVNDSRTRPSHAAKNGTILRRDHPWWLKNTPPCGYRCRCTVISLTEAQALKRGVSASPPDAVSDVGWDFHPSEYDEVLAKSEAKKLDALELKTKQASAQIGNFGGAKNASKEALKILQSIEDAAKGHDLLVDALMENATKRGLTLSPKSAQLIVGYTLDGYDVISKIKVKKGFDEADNIAMGLINSLVEDLAVKFPNLKQTIYRGLSLIGEGLFDFERCFKEGLVVEWKTIASASTNPFTAAQFSECHVNRVPIRITISNAKNKGFDIVDAGLQDVEKEVIIDTSVKLLIEKFITTDTGVRLVTAKIVDATTPTNAIFALNHEPS